MSSSNTSNPLDDMSDIFFDLPSPLSPELPTLPNDSRPKAELGKKFSALLLEALLQYQETAVGEGQWFLDFLRRHLIAKKNVCFLDEVVYEAVLELPCLAHYVDGSSSIPGSEEASLDPTLTPSGRMRELMSRQAHHKIQMFELGHRCLNISEGLESEKWEIEDVAKTPEFKSRVFDILRDISVEQAHLTWISREIRILKRCYGSELYLTSDDELQGDDI